MFYVYILHSQTTGKTYVGQTDDLARRVREHNAPGHYIRKFTTKQNGPWILCHTKNSKLDQKPCNGKNG